MAQPLLDTHVETPMRDGVTLASYVIRPASSDAHPVPLILERSPYHEGALRAMSRVPHLRGRPDIMLQGFAANVGLELSEILDAGFAVAVTECRGTGRSGGMFRWMAAEGDDGVDLAHWFARQSWCSRVLGWGPSYRSATQLTTVLADPGAMAAVSPWVAPSPTPDDWAGRGGVPEFAPTIAWALDRVHDAADRGDLVIAEDLPPRADPMPGILSAGPQEWADRLAQYPPSRHASASLLGEPAASRAGHYPLGALEALPVPGFHLGGWYDVFLGGTLRNYTAMRRGPAGADQHLVIGPWTHVDQVGRIPGYPFPGQSTLAGGGISAAQLDFWRRHGLDADVTLPRVRLYLMGADEWLDVADWPVPDARVLELFLAGDTLGASPPVTATFREWSHEPSSPVPTVGGQMLWGKAEDMGPLDQRPVEARPDVVSFSTEPLTEPLDVVGPVALRVFVSADVPSVNLHATLTDVAPDGRSTILTDGTLKVDTSGDITDVEIDLWATGNRFRAGHRVRLNVAASNWPRYVVGPRPARISVHAGPQTPSVLRLQALPVTATAREVSHDPS